MKKFIGLIVLMLVGRVYDAWSTYCYIPDLKGEVNPISSLLGGGWTALLATQAILITVIVMCMYYYRFRFRPPVPSSALSFREYISFLNFNDPTSFNKIFYAMPANKQVLAASLGYVVSRTLICISYIVGTSTTLLLLSDAYRSLYKHGGPAVLIAIAVLLALFFSYRFYKVQYRQYLHKA